ncbi:nuclease-related domain-containing DEAD/DEAH box helicase [Herbiconiux sp. VKM Ac-2851]|uniref:nuclease-related domain-containing DEAD/DEAH box helicase n=1 Tax=Herbiconiux sp. VKM Ac-2851 TaxID=2739025 RepID=UPI001567816D|nr:NERD domain-containing protein [Herbiconiux sp. VKM Ac-2851]NQX33297.1 NERD domain-containing protein [Herbiconiux sp. VKM Ac-2851]
MILVPCLADIETTSRSEAERRVARLLRDVVEDDDAVAFYSVGLRSHAYKQQAEADFVILWRGTVVVVEVKGGGVRKHDGLWYSIDRRRDWHRLGTSPMEQARSAAYALRKILKEQGIGWYAHEAVVLTPDTEAPPDSVDWKPTHWLARDAMSAGDLTSALNAMVVGAQKAPHGTKVARLADLRTRLFGEFTRMPVVDAQRGAVIEEQNRATDGQARVLASLARNKRVLVYGGAGTGKSLVLVEAAKQEAERGRSVLVTFRSPSLAQYFAPHLHDRAVDVIPFADLEHAGEYDVVLVDEAQDMMTAEAMDRLDATIIGGRATGRWRMFLDPNNQAHVEGDYDPDVAELIAEEAITVDLSLNVRNTRAIVHVVQEYLGADVGDPGIVNGERVEWHTTDQEVSVDDGVRIAEALVADGARRSDIWVIDPRSVAAPVAVGGVTVTSPRFSKGLEAEHVVVCGLPANLDESGTAAFYVAVTRARVSLHVVLSKGDTRRLQHLLRQGAMNR